ncbi:MAG: hypothetical protein ABIX01_01200 [Chitinophagaceae bacterium]
MKKWMSYFLFFTIGILPGSEVVAQKEKINKSAVAAMMKNAQRITDSAKRANPEMQLTKVFGETKPIAGNAALDGQTQNRRVEFV